MREEKQKKEDEEREAQRRAEEEEERKRKEEEEEARRKAEEEEEEKKRMEEEARRKEEEMEAQVRAEEEEEAARKEEEAQKRREEAEENQLMNEPQTREHPDIELITEEMLDEDDNNKSSSNTEEEEEEEEARDKDEELEDELNLETNGTPAEAGPQLDDSEDKENQTLEQSDLKSGLSSDKADARALMSTSPDQGSDTQGPRNNSTLSNDEQNRVRPTLVNKGQSSRSQEKREQRRRRGLEHNQRETDRAASFSSVDKSQDAAKLKERSESKELDQYAFVTWKMKEDKGGKKEAKSSDSAPVRPSTLSLTPVDSAAERNGHGESAGSVNLQRRPGAMKEKPEKWRGRRSDAENSENTSPPTQNTEERRKITL